MSEIWPPPPQQQTPPVPPPEGGRDVLAAALIAAVLLPVNAVLVFMPGPQTAPLWWPYAFAAAFGGLLICWMYAFVGGLLHCRSRLPRLGLLISAGTAGLCLLAYQAAHWLRLKF